MTMFSRSIPDPGCLSDLQLDTWRAGELDETVIRSLEQHLAGCARCARRKHDLEEEAAEFVRCYPEPPRLPAEPRPVSARRTGSARRWAISAGAVAMAAGVALWLRSTPPLDVRTKGAAHLGFFVKRGAEVVRGADGERVRAGDRLRFVLTSSKPEYVAILGRDGSGETFVYHPRADVSAPLAAGREIALESSVELDTTPGDEVIWAMFCQQPFEIAPLRAVLAQRGELSAPPGCVAESLHLKKEVR